MINEDKSIRAISLAIECLEWFRSVKWAKRMHVKSINRTRYFVVKQITRRLCDERTDKDFYFSEDFSLIYIIYSNFRMSRLMSMTQRVWNIIIIIINSRDKIGIGFTSKEQYVTQRARDAYMTSICQSTTSFDLSFAIQSIEISSNDITILNKQLQWQIDNHTREFKYVKLDSTKLQLMVHPQSEGSKRKEKAVPESQDDEEQGMTRTNVNALFLFLSPGKDLTQIVDNTELQMRYWKWMSLNIVFLF